MIRKILVPIRGDGKGDNVLAHAAAMARRFDAHIVATHCRPRPEDLMPYGVPVPAFLRDQLMTQAQEVADLEEKNLHEKFSKSVNSFGLTAAEGPMDKKPSASWVEEPGRQVDIIKRHGRLADLIAVAKPDTDRNLGANTLKAALFNTGRPVLMCPPRETPPETLGKRIAIAWNGSTEAARAVALSADVIEKAADVTILCAGDEVHGASSNDLVAYLSLRRVAARIDRFTAKRKTGEELLNRTEAAGADLMIMGAYGDSHEHETVFGGNTQIVVDSAMIPVILVH